MTPSLNRLAVALLAAFAALALATGYWSIARGPELAGRNDNPRRFIAETRIRRGPIYDRHRAVLAETSGVPGDYSRAYPLPEAAPVVGYASLIYGVTGVEEAANPVLRGEEDRTPLEAWWQNGVLGAPQIGRGVRLSLDSDLQRAAAAALGGDTGAIVVLDAIGGDVLAMVSSPTFDPNTLDADWESLIADQSAPLLNRATLGSYQPGGALQPILLAAAVERGLAGPDDAVVNAAQAISWRGGVLNCPPPDPASPFSLAAAFASDCPAPFADLGARISASDLAQLFADFGLYDAPGSPLPAAASPRTPIAENDRRLAAAGLGDLRVSPLQMALVAAAFANHGVIPALRLITATQNAAGDWAPQPQSGHPRSVIGAPSANAVAALFSPSADGRGGPGAACAPLCGVRAIGHASLALTGPNAEPIAWYLGFAPAPAPKYAIAVLVENGTRQRARQIGEAVLTKAAEK